MSILLDALRKSEEQRRLGEVPDIHSPLASEHRATGAWRRWVLFGAIGVISLAAAWFGWRQLSGTDRAPDASQERAELAVSRSADAVAEPDGRPAAETAVGDPVPAAPAPAETEAASEVAADAPGAPRAAPPKSRVNESFTAFEASPQVVAEQQPESPSEAAPAAAQTVETAVAAIPDQAPAEPPPRAVEPSKTGPVETDPRKTEPISFWELPQSVRDSLPDFRITVLVYADQAEDRFVLIGGNRLVEKDQLQDGVVLDEIRRDGAVFTYRNYRFLVEG
jgi:general secretion pathway protein B